MKPAPFASIVIPTFNQAMYLRAALDSVIAQTDGDWEAVVVNDGSTDNTREVAEGYADKDARIRVFHQENGGVAAALNKGLREARGEWIHWLSSDDLFEPEKLATNRIWIERHPETNFFFSYFTLLRQSTGEKDRRGLWGPLPKPEHQILTLFYRNYISGISICVRRSAWEGVGHFDTGLRYAQDYDQWLRLLQRIQARFIPEWTVISRNHAEQGSETFPDACYFDTAKAAIRFINRHPFEELVPWVSLDDPLQAEEAVRMALDVACDPTSFIYCMGVHPGLMLRILEWVFSREERTPSVERMVRDRVQQMSLKEGDDDWCWMWGNLATALTDAKPRVTYDAIDTLSLSISQWRKMLLADDPKHAAMQSYLKRFDHVDPQEVSPDALGRSRVAFVLNANRDDIAMFVSAARKLCSHGLRPVVLVEAAQGSMPTLRWSDGVPTIAVRSLDRDTLPWLGELELAVTTTEEPPTWLGYLERLSAADLRDVESLERRVLDTLQLREDRLPVVFLERVLWGGGAERVVHDLARHLDAKRFAVSIVTMFAEHSVGPKLPQHIRLCSLHDVEMTRQHSVPHERRRPLAIRVLRKAYHGLFPLSVRQKFGIGDALRLSLRLFSAWRALRARGAAGGAVLPHVDGKPDGAASDLSFDFISPMMHYNPVAVKFAEFLGGLGERPLVLSVMEEAAVTAFLARTTVSFDHICTLHTLESACMRDIFRFEDRYHAEKRLLTVACREADVVTFPSDGCCEDMTRCFDVPAVQIRKIWNPLDCARIGRLAQERLEACEAWRSANPGFRFVSVGRLDPQKNHELLLDACALLKQQGRVFSLAIVGDGWYRPNIEKRIKDLHLEGQVLLCGAQENPFPWIAASDALVLTSRFEAFALVLAEAMACGTPAVAIDCPTGPAEVLANGEFGLLADQDAVSVAECLKRLMDDEELRESLRKQGYARAELFDIKKIVAEWEGLIETVVARTKAGTKKAK